MSHSILHPTKLFKRGETSSDSCYLAPPSFRLCFMPDIQGSQYQDAELAFFILFSMFAYKVVFVFVIDSAPKFVEAIGFCRILTPIRVRVLQLLFVFCFCIATEETYFFLSSTTSTCFLLAHLLMVRTIRVSHLVEHHEAPSSLGASFLLPDRCAAKPFHG